ncbi:MAG: prolipoprotein diacylglyceryl transferase family protein [Planctomycetota bacterium]|nr:prolipoprotein diacylglyceryl transferase family protein [Planctomycetota bacterium]
MGTVVLAWIAAKKGLGNDFWGAIPIFLVVAVVLKFVIPLVMVKDPETGENLGLAIRGYGFFLLLGVLTGVGLAVHRSRQLGLHPDTILNLCFWLFITGIAGARLFYVIQYWPQFQANGTASIAKIINMTEGGLVVYGGIIGGVIGGSIFLLVKKMPLLPILDILAPCMMIGLSIGRIGCLMNGCCWGGICEDQGFSIRFPEGSPPYARHVETGELFGMKALPMQKRNPETGREIIEVEPGSPADRVGIETGDRIIGYSYNPNPNDNKLPEEIVYHINGKGGTSQYVFDGPQIPVQSKPVHPSQIYSSINALFVFLFLWFYFPCRTRDGQVLGLLMVVYPIGRFLLEIIRSDELGQFGTQLTISQLTSIGSITGGVLLLVYGFFGLNRVVSFQLSGNPRGSS